MAKVLVLFHSRTGNTAALADAIAEGARSVRFTEVDVRRLADLAPEGAAPAADRARLESYRVMGDPGALTEYDAIVLGGPTRYGGIPHELERFLDSLAPLWRSGALADRVGAAFTSARTRHGGHELTLQAIMTAMGSFGMILAPPGYTDPVMHEGGSPYGATATTGDAGPTAADLAAARHTGARVARIAGWVRHAKGHEAGPAHGHAHAHSHEGGHHHHH